MFQKSIKWLGCPPRLRFRFPTPHNLSVWTGPSIRTGPDGWILALKLRRTEKHQPASPNATPALRPPPEDQPTGTARPQATAPAATARKTPPGSQPQPRRDPATDQPQPPPGKARHCPAKVGAKVKDKAVSPRATAALRPPPLCPRHKKNCSPDQAQTAVPT